MVTIQFGKTPSNYNSCDTSELLKPLEVLTGEGYKNCVKQIESQLPGSDGEEVRVGSWEGWSDPVHDSECFYNGSYYNSDEFYYNSEVTGHILLQSEGSTVANCNVDRMDITVNLDENGPGYSAFIQALKESNETYRFLRVDVPYAIPGGALADGIAGEPCYATDRVSVIYRSDNELAVGIPVMYGDAGYYFEEVNDEALKADVRTGNIHVIISGDDIGVHNKEDLIETMCTPEGQAKIAEIAKEKIRDLLPIQERVEQMIKDGKSAEAEALHEKIQEEYIGHLFGDESAMGLGPEAQEYSMNILRSAIETNETELDEQRNMDHMPRLPDGSFASIVGPSSSGLKNLPNNPPSFSSEDEKPPVK